MGDRFSGRERTGWLLAALGALLFAVSLYLVFVYAPREATLGEVQRIFYFHMGTAWNAFFAFGVVFVASIAFLRTRSRYWDRVAVSAAEIGVLFTTIVLLTGSIWGGAAWNAWWTWDPRLTTTLVLWFIYVAYLIMRASVEGWERRARYAAVFGIIGFVDVPIVFMSIRWWRTIHPLVLSSSGFAMDSQMLPAMWFGLISFTFLFFVLLRQRVQIEALKDEANSLKDEFVARTMNK